MIDPTRWILAEAWLTNGLRIEWAITYGVTRDDKSWQEDEDNSRYRYKGFGVWEVLDKERGYSGGRTNAGYTAPKVPQLATPTMKHELAHWLVATEEKRGEVNFGLKEDDRDGEETTLMAERVITSIIDASARIASMALMAPARGVSRGGEHA